MGLKWYHYFSLYSPHLGVDVSYVLSFTVFPLDHYCKPTSFHLPVYRWLTGLTLSIHGHFPLSVFDCGVLNFSWFWTPMTHGNFRIHTYPDLCSLNQLPDTLFNVRTFSGKGRLCLQTVTEMSRTTSQRSESLSSGSTSDPWHGFYSRDTVRTIHSQRVDDEGRTGREQNQTANYT